MLIVLSMTFRAEETALRPALRDFSCDSNLAGFQTVRTRNSRKTRCRPLSLPLDGRTISQKTARTTRCAKFCANTRNSVLQSFEVPKTRICASSSNAMSHTTGCACRSREEAKRLVAARSHDGEQCLQRLVDRCDVARGGLELPLVRQHVDRLFVDRDTARRLRLRVEALSNEPRTLCLRVG